jgi:DNA-binding MarR family transcriptional regulator
VTKTHAEADDLEIARPETAQVVLDTANDLRVVVAHLTRRLREQTPADSFTLNLTRSQASVLSRIERDGAATMSTLAQAEGMRPQSMSAIVSTLVAAGYIEGSPDPTDGRKTLLSLTPLARGYFDTGRLAKVDWLHRTISTELTRAEQAQLRASIDLLRKLALAP